MRHLVSLCVLAALASATEPRRLPHQPTGNGSKLLTYNITTGNPGELAVSTTSVTWVKSDEDGDFITEDEDGSFVFENVASGNKTTFLSAGKIPAGYFDYEISPDQSRVLWAVNYTKQYRHSYFADYLVQNVATGETESLVKDSKGDIQYATWHPASSSQIAFVRGNDLFLWDQGTTSQITDNGGPDMFNAVPDWVYEEEVFSTNNALWFSPDGQYIAFLSFNETGVETFTIPYYLDNKEVPPPYPRELKLRYPKVGTKNPTVSLNLFDVKAKTLSPVAVDAWPADDLIIGEVAWVTDGHDKLIYRAYNRVQDREKLVVVDIETKKSTVSRERDGSDGWLDNNLVITYIGQVNHKSSRDIDTRATSTDRYYLDVSDASGWNHLYLFALDGGANITLTSGPWEVDSILKVDTARQLIHYTSTERDPTERHVYSVSYTTGLKTPLVDTSTPAVWSASFSSSGGYYILRYAGPDVPYQDLHALTTPPSPAIRTINANTPLHTALQTYRLPNITYLTLPGLDGGVPLTAMLRLPATFTPTKKYPLLLTPYGGPGSQSATKAFQPLTFTSYIASDPDLEYITLTVDNRGTGFRGRAFRAQVARRLGELEAQDQLWAARWLAERHGWVDGERVGIWGWSYGGYLAAKVVEAQGAAPGGGVVAFGIATAPVADWRFYDSVYTERYMKRVGENRAGYEKSAVKGGEGFKGLRGGFLVQHGTGDDNVHFQNSAVLGGLVVGGGVGAEKLKVTFFADSDHGIRYRGQNGWLYKQLSAKLYEERKREGTGGGHQWSRRGRVWEG